jgi:hypothetical protein
VLFFLAPAPDCARLSPGSFFKKKKKKKKTRKGKKDKESENEISASFILERGAGGGELLRSSAFSR